MYYPTFWDWLTLFGTIGFFLLAFLLFARLLPVISIAGNARTRSLDGGRKTHPHDV